MMCFGFGAIEHLIIWVIVVCAVFAIIRILLSRAGLPAEFAWVIDVVKIILWAAVAIAIVVVLFLLLSCIVPVRL